jgi:hypothetical protein
MPDGTGEETATLFGDCYKFLRYVMVLSPNTLVTKPSGGWWRGNGSKVDPQGRRFEAAIID